MSELVPESIRALRLQATGLLASPFSDPVAVVRWMGAVQAQEEHHAKAAIALRAGVDIAAVDRAIAEGRIVRTWLMRGTLHFVAEDDLRWIQTTVAEAMIQKAAPTMRLVGWHDAELQRSNAVLAAALAGAGPVPRAVLVEQLAAAGLDMKGPMSPRVFTHAAYSGVLCLGPTVGKQETFVALGEWISPTPPRTRAEAIAMLAQRYFQSHAPATKADFVAWSGLGVREARAGIAALGLSSTAAYFHSNHPSIPGPVPKILLLPGFDEYLLGYRDRSLVLDPAHKDHVLTSNGIFRPVILRDGVVVGTWQRKELRSHIELRCAGLPGGPAIQEMDVEAALAPLARVWGMEVRINP